MDDREAAARNAGLLAPGSFPLIAGATEVFRDSDTFSVNDLSAVAAVDAQPFTLEIILGSY